MAKAEAVADAMAATIGSQAKMICMLQVELQEVREELAKAQPAQTNSQEGSQ